MSFDQHLRFDLILAGVTLAFAANFAPTARANVYATNVKFNGTTNATNLVGDSIRISYILNEPAPLGVTVRLLSGTNVVRTFSLAGDTPGARRGLNEVLWDGRDGSSNYLAAGTYSASITAASSGYTNWTQLTFDGEGGTYVYAGRGIAVDRNPQSPYYGRVFVANADAGPDPNGTPGDRLGILKLNADASAADEGISSGGLDGHDWAGGELSPSKLTVSEDDLVYVNDLANGGEVFRWDPTFSTNSLLYVLRQDNRPTGAHLIGPAITAVETNTQIWMADLTSNTGIRKWTLGPVGVCASNDLGTVVVGVGGDLKLNPSDLALDKLGNIYACQSVTASGDTNSRVLRFPSYDPATNGGVPELSADWTAGMSNNAFGGASGLAVDPTSVYLAVSFRGINAGGFSTNGNTKILSTADGAVVADLDLGLAMDGQPYTIHDDTDCAWDAVGNVYYIDNFYGYWRAVSPPGTNQATTFGAATVQLSLAPILITRIVNSAGNVTIDFTASVTELPTAFVVLGAGSIGDAFSPVAGAQVTQVGPGVFRATFPANAQMQYYRIARQVVVPHATSILNLAVASGTVTINFSAGANDLPAAFTLVSATDPGGPYSVAAGASISQVSPGTFRATAPLNGPRQFYRIRR